MGLLLRGSLRLRVEEVFVFEWVFVFEGVFIFEWVFVFKGVFGLRSSFWGSSFLILPFRKIIIMLKDFSDRDK